LNAIFIEQKCSRHGRKPYIDRVSKQRARCEIVRKGIKKFNSIRIGKVNKE